MGGMAVLEWPLLYPVRFPRATPSRADDEAPDNAVAPYIRAVVPLATAARHSAWCISWAEAQRQSIYSDPAFDHGYYDPTNPPRSGLAAARMAALLTYRSRDSFESRFGRRIGGPKKGNGKEWQAKSSASVTEEAALLHNEGNQSPRVQAQRSPTSSLPAVVLGSSSKNGNILPSSAVQTKPFSAQSYLRYQGDKFVKRFDANCYIHLTRKMDSHDVARGRAHWGLADSDGLEPVTAQPIEVNELTRQRSHDTAVEEVTVGEKRLPREGEEDDEALERVLGLLSANTYRFGAPAPPVFIVSVESDGLFAPPEQEQLHQYIRGSQIVTIRSPDGHDGFLLEFEQINQHVEKFLGPILPDIYQPEHGVGYEEWKHWGEVYASGLGTGGDRPVKESMSGEVEDLTRW